MSQVGKQAAGGGIQAAPQRLDPRGVITAQRPEATTLPSRSVSSPVGASAAVTTHPTAAHGLAAY